MSDSLWAASCVVRLTRVWEEGSLQAFWSWSQAPPSCHCGLRQQVLGALQVTPAWPVGFPSSNPDQVRGKESGWWGRLCPPHPTSRPSCSNPMWSVALAWNEKHTKGYFKAGKSLIKIKMPFTMHSAVCPLFFSGSSVAHVILGAPNGQWLLVFLARL